MRTLESFIREAKEETQVVPKAAPSPHDGFVIREVEMKGFMRYLRPTRPPIAFPQKFTAITGLTGAGKTSILDAISFALYKRTTRTDVQGIKISEICRKDGYVRLVFSQGGSTYEVTRGFNSNGSPYLELKRDGSPIRGTIPELEKVIQEVIGLDYDGFRNSTFVRQEEMKQLGADSPSERLEVFQKLFRLETFAKAAEVAKDRLDVLRREMKEAEGRLAVLKEQMAQLPDLQDEVKALKEEVGGNRRSLKEIEALLSAQEQKVLELERSHEAYIGAKTTVEGVESSLTELDSKLREREEALSRLPELRERVKALSKEVEALRALEAEAEELDGRRQRHAVLRERLAAVESRRDDLEASLHSQLERLEARIAEEESRLAGLSVQMGVDEAFDILRKEGALEERLARIEKELEWLSERLELAEALRKEQKEGRTALEEVRERSQSINKDVFLYSEIKDRLDRLRRDLEERRREWEERRQELAEQLHELKEELRSVGFGDEEERRLLELQASLKKLKVKQEKLQLLQEDLQRLEGAEDLVQEMRAQREELSRRLEEKRKLLKEAQASETAYEQARQELEVLRSRKEKALRSLSESEARLQALSERLEALLKTEMRARELEESLEGLRQRAEVLTVLREGVFHRKGIVMYAINRLLPELEIEGSKNLRDLTNGRLKRVKLETHEEARGYGIRILVEGVDGEWHDVGVFSGGERTQINAALRFAIARELASMPQVGRTYGRMKTLFIDEGDLGSLDTESSRELFVSKLFKMGEFFEKVILITHLADVAERFPGRIRVTMTPEGESRAEVVA